MQWLSGVSLRLAWRGLPTSKVSNQALSSYGNAWIGQPFQRNALYCLCGTLISAPICSPTATWSDSMTAPHSDALVFFGATGDLAYKKIFPALQAMVRRGHLNIPVIGVAKAGWNLDQFKAR